MAPEPIITLQRTPHMDASPDVEPAPASRHFKYRRDRVPCCGITPRLSCGRSYKSERAALAIKKRPTASTYVSPQPVPKAIGRTRRPTSDARPARRNFEAHRTRRDDRY